MEKVSSQEIRANSFSKTMGTSFFVTESLAYGETYSYW